MGRRTQATYQELESLIAKLAECVVYKNRGVPHIYPAADPYDELVFDLEPGEALALMQATGPRLQVGWLFEDAFPG